MASFRTVKGFRDLFPQECALRNYIAETWRAVARRYGFIEYEAPLIESTDLYKKKSGDEITAQLFCFEDKGGRDISLRPEVTPSLARMATTRQRDFKKPLKWFEMGSCFRYEEPQEGRSREFIQFNADILGDSSPGADAELIALAVDVMLEFGLRKEDFLIRLSNREIWNQFNISRSRASPRSTAPPSSRSWTRSSARSPRKPRRSWKPSASASTMCAPSCGPRMKTIPPLPPCAPTSPRAACGSM